MFSKLNININISLSIYGTFIPCLLFPCDHIFPI